MIISYEGADAVIKLDPDEQVMLRHALERGVEESETPEEAAFLSDLWSAL